MPIEQERARWKNLLALCEEKEARIAQIVGENDPLGIARATAFLSPLGTMTKAHREEGYDDTYALSARLLQEYFLPPEKQRLANAVECLLLGYEEGLDDLGYSLYTHYDTIPAVSLNDELIDLLKRGTDRLQPDIWKDWPEEKKERYFARVIRYAYSAWQFVERERLFAPKRDEKETSSPFTSILTTYQRAVGRDNVWYVSGSRQAIRHETMFEIGYTSYRRWTLAYSFALVRAMKQQKERIICIHPNEATRRTAYEEARQLFGKEVVGNLASSRQIQFGTLEEVKRAIFHHTADNLAPYASFARSIIIIDQYELCERECLLPLMQEMEYIRSYFDATIVWMHTLPYSAWLSTKVRYLSFDAYPTLLLKNSSFSELAPIRRAYWTRDMLRKIVKEESRAVLFIARSRTQAGYIVDEYLFNNQEVCFLDPHNSFEEKEKNYEEIRQYLSKGEPIAVVATECVPITFPVIYIERMPIEQMRAMWGRAQEEYVLWEEVGATYRTEPLDIFFDVSRHKWQKWWDARLTTKYLTHHAYEDIRFKTRSQQLENK